ncbi:ankyrin repeat-containing domain protein [Hypoxylon sp. FL0890]|nr:ankyrin repeat-containing domain protein [Hypoxylon sp. FL0890]
MAGWDRLPLELILHITGYLSIHDTSAVSRLNKKNHWLLFDSIFTRGYKARVEKGERDIISCTLFPHAFRHNSASIAKWLSSHKEEIDLKGTRLHVETIPDAPAFVINLAKYGINVKCNINDTDFTELLALLTQHLVCGPRDLDRALHVACTQALPRTARFFMIHGANPNYLSPLGFSVLHRTVMALSVLEFKKSYKRFNYTYDDHVSKFIAVLHLLLDFNADANLQTTISRNHVCGHGCWRSPDCVSSGQTALHLASSSGLYEAAVLLLERGADPNLANADGFCPLYTALAQGHVSIAILLINHMGDGVNPVVNKRDDANAPDSRDRTPLHEVLGQTYLEAEQDVVATLKRLDDFGADPNLEVPGGESPRQLAVNHPFQSVREMFIILQTTERKSRLKPPNPGKRTTQHTPPPKPPPKIPAPHFPVLQGIWASDQVQEVLRELAVGYSVQDRDADKPNSSREDFPPLNATDGVVHVKGSVTMADMGVLHMEEDKGTGMDRSSQEGVQNAAAQFWKEFQKRPVPKAEEAHGDGTKTKDDLTKRQTSDKQRRRKKWTPLKLD